MLDGARPDAEDRRRRVLAIRYENIPLGDHPLRMRSSEPGETYYSKEFGEAISFAHLAVGADIDDQIADTVSKAPPEPDLIVTFTDGSQKYVEVAQVIEEQSARASSTIAAINKHIANRYFGDPAYAAANAGRHIDFTFPNVPTSRETKTVADEMVAVLYATDFSAVERRTFLKPSSIIAPTLNRLGARYYVGVGNSTALSAQLDAHTFDPEESADDLDTRLADKLKKHYARGLPIWLALALNDHKQIPSFSMDVIRQRVPTTIGQFECVVFGTMEDAHIIRTTI